MQKAKAITNDIVENTYTQKMILKILVLRPQMRKPMTDFCTVCGTLSNNCSYYDSMIVCNVCEDDFKGMTEANDACAEFDDDPTHAGLAVCHYRSPDF